MNIAKYEFNSKEQAQTKIDALGTITDENGNESPNHNHAIVTLGHIVLESAIFDENGEVITEAVLSEGWHLDVMWRGLTDHPYGWKSYNVDLTNEGSHSFMGVSYLDNKF
tara:strand:- start:3261 stop:3590 length:330 start_codon:yes stop_codon:yes gene_type:complete